MNYDNENKKFVNPLNTLPSGSVSWDGGPKPSWPTVPAGITPTVFPIDLPAPSLDKKVSVDNAPGFLDEAVATLRARAKLRDAGDEGERSMLRTVNIFNAWTGCNISVENGWRFMAALKMAREIQGSYNRDDYVDLAAYSSLLGEEVSRRKGQ